MHPALRLLAADDGAVVVDDVGVDGVVVAEGDDGRDELGRSSGADLGLEDENSDDSDLGQFASGSDERLENENFDL